MDQITNSWRRPKCLSLGVFLFYSPPWKRQQRKDIKTFAWLAPGDNCISASVPGCPLKSTLGGVSLAVILFCTTVIGLPASKSRMLEVLTVSKGLFQPDEDFYFSSHIPKTK